MVGTRRRTETRTAPQAYMLIQVTVSGQVCLTAPFSEQEFRAYLADRGLVFEGDGPHHHDGHIWWWDDVATDRRVFVQTLFCKEDN